MQSSFRSSTPLVVLFLISMLPSCSKNSPTAPTPAAHPAISVASITVSGETRSSGYAYRVVMHLRETAGVMATISSVQLTFANGGKNVASSRFDQPLATGSTIPPNGTADTKELVTVDDSGNPYASTVQAVVTFSDGASFTGTASGPADVPPLPGPPPPQTYTLTGVITDVTTHATIEGARLDVLTGSNTGKSAMTDAFGTYILHDLVADSFRLRASAPGYDSGEQGVTVPTVPRADFELRRTASQACTYTIAPSGSLTVSFTAGQFAVTITRTGGTCDWHASTDVNWLTPAASSGSASATLLVSYLSNTSFVGRTGSVMISWSGGNAQLSIGQSGEMPVFCRSVTVTVSGQNPVSVPAVAGRYTALIVPEPGIPPGVCGSWTASASAGISFPGPSAGPQAPASLTFDVGANALPTTRQLQITISFPPNGPSTGLTINQGGTP